MGRLLVLTLFLSALPWSVVQGQLDGCDRNVLFYFDVTASVMNYGKEQGKEPASTKLKSVTESLLSNEKVFRDGYGFMMTAFGSLDKVHLRNEGDTILDTAIVNFATINSKNRQNIIDRSKDLLFKTKGGDNYYNLLFDQITRDVRNNPKDVKSENLVFVFSDLLFDTKNEKLYQYSIKANKTSLVRLHRALDEYNYKLVFVIFQHDSVSIDPYSYSIKDLAFTLESMPQITDIDCKENPTICSNPQNLIDKIEEYVVGDLKISSTPELSINQSESSIELTITNTGCRDEVIINDFDQLSCDIGNKQLTSGIDHMIDADGNPLELPLNIEHGESKNLILILNEGVGSLEAQELNDEKIENIKLKVNLSGNIAQTLTINTGKPIKKGYPELKIEELWVMTDAYGLESYQQIRVTLQPLKKKTPIKGDYKILLTLEPPNRDNCDYLTDTIEVSTKESQNLQEKVRILSYDDPKCWEGSKEKIKYKIQFLDSDGKKYGPKEFKETKWYSVSLIIILITTAILSSTLFLVVLFVSSWQFKQRLIYLKKKISNNHGAS